MGKRIRQRIERTKPSDKETIDLGSKKVVNRNPSQRTEAAETYQGLAAGLRPAVAIQDSLQRRRLAGALSPVARVRTRTAVLGGSPCRACAGQGTDAEPLDGGALTLRWTHSPARGPAAPPPFLLWPPRWLPPFRRCRASLGMKRRKGKEEKLGARGSLAVGRRPELATAPARVFGGGAAGSDRERKGEIP